MTNNKTLICDLSASKISSISRRSLSYKTPKCENSPLINKAPNTPCEDILKKKRPKSDLDDFFDTLDKFQSGKMDDQRYRWFIITNLFVHKIGFYSVN